MEQSFQILQKFMNSKQCIFQFKPIDYPTALQQRLITSYYQLNQLLRTTSHNQLVRILHASVDRQLQTLVPGLLYTVLVDANNSQQLFQKYMTILRSDAWVALDRLLQQLLKESFLAIMSQYRSSIFIIVDKLLFFGQLSPDSLILLIKTMDSFDLSQHSLNYNNNLLQLIQQKIVLNPTPQMNGLMQVLADTLFYKLMRMLAVICLVEEETVREYRNRCIAIAIKLFQYDRNRCLSLGWAIQRLLQELEKEEELTLLIQSCRQHIGRNCQPSESPLTICSKLSMVLPLRVQTTILFIIRQSISQKQIGLQLDWVFNKKTKHQQHYQLLYIDILRYILAIPPQQIPLLQAVLIMEWLLYRCSTNNILIQCWKSQLFHPCFCDPCPFPAAPQRALWFINFLFQNNFDFGETLLIYLLRHIPHPTYAKRIAQLLQQANSAKIMDISALLSHPRLGIRTQTELKNILGIKKQNKDIMCQQMKQTPTIQYYDPLFQIINRKQSQMSISFSDSEQSHNYNDNSEEMINESPEEQNNTANQSKVRLEKQFVQDVGEALSCLMKDPSLNSYKQFFKKFMQQVKTLTINGELTMIDSFIAEASKITYLLFQNQFQQHVELFAREQNIIIYILSIVAVEWRTNSLQVKTAKKIVKRITEMFSTSEPTIWQYFLLNFKRGVYAQARQMKEWLIPKEKSDFVVASIRQLGGLTKQVVDSAQQMKLPFL